MLRVLVGTNDADHEDIIKAAKSSRSFDDWVVPKESRIGDPAVVFIRSSGFVAKAAIASETTKSSFRGKVAYRARIDKLEMLKAPISLDRVQREVPAWKWTNAYSKSCNTPAVEVADKLLKLFHIGTAAATPQSTPSTDEVTGPAPRRVEMLSRVVRNTVVTEYVKGVHGNRCQVCGSSVSLPKGLQYSEGAHIRPLGRPHDGPDDKSNVLCLCPNHHVQLDYGSISIRDDLTLLGVSGRLRSSPLHKIDVAHLEWHRKQFGWK